MTPVRRWAGGVAAAAIVAIATLALLSPSPRSGGGPTSEGPPEALLASSAPIGSRSDGPSPFADRQATGSPGPSSSPMSVVGPMARLDAEPTRVVIASLDIDLPVIRPSPKETYPLCDVAEFLPSYGLPGLPGVTYLYAHARRGMFLPLLEASRTHGGQTMLGKEIDLFSSDRVRRRYEITEIHPRVKDLDVVNDLAGDALVLQTSETSRSSGTKLVVVARPIGPPALSSDRAARPSARPRVCAD
jgi:hypothetical protein